MVSRRIMLSPAQIAFFKASGYLRVPAAQAQLDAELMERARADLWDGEPALLESDPSSWLGTVDELVDEERGLTPEALSAAGHAGSRWIVRKSAKEDWMLQIVARNERIRGMISQLLGPWEGISEPGTRGLYCTRPCYRKSGERIPPELIEPRVDSDNKGPADTDGTSPCTSILGGEGIHSDGLGMDRVGAVAYIGDCPAGAGGFTDSSELSADCPDCSAGRYNTHALAVISLRAQRSPNSRCLRQKNARPGLFKVL